MEDAIKRYRYMLTDGYSNFAWLFSTRTTESGGDMRKCETMSSIFGYPTRATTDRRTPVKTRTFIECTEGKNNEQILSVTEVLRGNGQPERKNWTKLSIRARSSWDSKPGVIMKSVSEGLIEEVFDRHGQDLGKDRRKGIKKEQGRYKKYFDLVRCVREFAVCKRISAACARVCCVKKVWRCVREKLLCAETVSDRCANLLRTNG